MKYINKLPEPQEFFEWKEAQKAIGVNCNYNSLSNPEKRIVHQSLLKEQGYICCYCCMKIQRDSSHIEHFDPQSKTNDDLSIDYGNLLASCGPLDSEQQKEKKQKWPKHCGNYRRNLNIPISPLQADCEDYFAYTAVGEIITNMIGSQTEAEETIARLGLNDPELILMRLRVLEPLLEILESMTDEEAQKMAQYYQSLNNLGHYEPFCVVIIYFLNQYFNI